MRGNRVEVRDVGGGYLQLSVYPRVCGGTVSTAPSDPPDCERVYPRVCGGTTRTTGPARSSRVRVYPRVCGGTRGRWPTAHHGTGLSPRVRGNLARHRRDAGSNRSSPRVCGGTICRSECSAFAWGLSPRVRGNQSRRYLIRRAEQTPVYPRVCGGTRLVWSSWGPSVTGVYPRVCGGTRAWTRSRQPIADVGLSPRVRGNPGEAVLALDHPDTVVYPRVCGGT